MPTPRLVPRPPPSTLVVLTGVIVGMGLVEVAMIQATAYEPLWVLLLFVWVGWVSAAAGLLASWRRPTNRLGVILILLGVSWLSAGLYNCGVPALEAVGGLTATLPLAVVVHLLHAFPSGRLVGAVSRLTVLAAYAVSLVFAVPQMLHQPGVLSIDVRPDLIRMWVDRQNLLGAVVMTVTALVLLRRLRSYDRPQRRVVVPLLSYGVLAVALVPLSSRFGDELFGLTPVGVAVTDLLAVGGVPVAFAFAVLLGGFARTGEIQELGAWLGTDGRARPGLTEAVAGTLGDPSVEVLFTGPPDGLGAVPFVDGAGAVVELPEAGTDGRGWVPIELAGETVGAVVYDTRINGDVALVEAAAAVIAIAVDRERLTADLLASRAALRSSTVRLVDAGDRERRRIAQDLHDGLQADLIVLALQAGRLTPPEDAADLRIRLDTAAADLRALVHGFMPALLVERGLYAAVEELADRLPIATRVSTNGPAPELGSPVESLAYLATAEALANAVKHSGASVITVDLTRRPELLVIDVRDDGVGGARPGDGAGLTGIADRVAVLGGRMRLESDAGHGTQLVLELPCAS